MQGVWYVQVTIRDCSTGVALAPAVNSLVTFAAGGTLHESVSDDGFAPGQQRDGHGTWTHKGGQTYDQRFVTMINFATAPVRARASSLIEPQLQGRRASGASRYGGQIGASARHLAVARLS